MAAHITGVHRFIKDPGTPWDQKLKLAQFAWKSEKCFIPNKHQVLLNWACTSITQASKFEIDKKYVNQLWLYLSDILGSVHLQQLMQKGALFSLRANFNLAVIERLERTRLDSAQLDVVVKCCCCILSYPTLAVNLTSNFDKLLQFAVALMKISVAYIAKTGGLFSDLKHVLEAVLKYYHSSLIKCTSARKLLIATCEHFLIPSFQLLLTTSPDLIIVRQKLEVILSLSIFNRDLHTGYMDYLKSFSHKHVKPTELKLIIFQIHNFFEFLLNSVNTCQGTALASIFGAFPKLFEWFIASLKPSNDLALIFLCKICSILNLCEDPIQSIPVDDNIKEMDQTETTTKKRLTKWSLVLPCLDRMLGEVIKHNIYHIAVDAAHGKPVFNWLNSLLQYLLNSDLEFSSSWYRCLHHMVDLNHLLVEPHLKEILIKCLLNTPEEPTEVKDHSLDSSAKIMFFDNLLQVYTKLRQFDQIVAVFLESIRDSKLSNFEWKHCLQNFPAYVHTLTPGLSLDIWKLFLSEISTHYISKTTTETDEPPAKKRKSLLQQIPVKKFQAVATLLKMFILELPLVSICATAPNLKKLKEIMSEMKENVLAQMLRSQVVNQDATLTFTTYILCHAWGEANMLLRQYTAYGQGQELSLPGSFRPGDFSYLHDYVTSKVWRASTSNWLKTNDKQIDSTMILLDFQQACCLILFEDIGEHKVKSAVEQMMSSVLSYSSTLTDHIIEGDTELFAVNYLVTLTSQFPIMIPFLSESQLILIARLFIKCLNSQNAKHSKKAANIVKQFLQSTVCMESTTFQIILLSVLLNEILGSMKKLLKLLPKDEEKMTQVFKIADDKIWDQVAEDILSGQEHDHEVWKHVKMVTMVIGSYGDGFRNGVSWNQKEINRLTDILKVLKLLPFECLIPSNHIRCVLVLCMLNYTLSQSSSSMPQGILDCLLTVRTFLKTLCQVDVRGLYLELSIRCKMLSSLTSALTKPTVLQEFAKDEHKLRTVTNDIISSLLTAAFKSDNESAMSEMSQLLQMESKQICKTLKESLENQSVTSVLGLLSVFLKQGTLLARRKNKNQKEMLKELSKLVENSSQLIQCLQRTSALCDCFREESTHSVIDTTPEESLEVVPEKLLVCNILQLSSVLLRYYADVIKISDNEESSKFERQWSSEFQPLLQNVLDSRILTSSDIVSRIIELFWSVCFIADVTDVVSGDLLESMWMKVIQYFKHDCDEEAKLCGQMILRCLETSRFSTIMLNIHKSLVGLTEINSQKFDDMKSSLTTLLIISSTNLQQDSWCVFKQSSPQIIQSLVDYLHLLCPVTPENADHVHSAVNVMTSMVAQGNDLVSANVAMTTLHAVHVVPLVDLPTQYFSDCFTVLFHLLNTLLLQYPKQVILSLPSFLQCVKYLLCSVMFHGREAIGNSTDKVPEKLLLECAEDMDRLLTLLASHKEDVQKVIVVLVAEYVNELQKGTMHSAVKKSLENGIHNIVSVCDDRSLALLGATLPDGLKEIYKGFYSDFKKYFKYTGRV